MKQRADNVLLAVLFVTAALYAFVLLTWLEVIPLRVNNQSLDLWNWLVLRFHAVPFFCLQLLLCRKLHWNLMRLLPLLLVGLAVCLLAAASFTADGWDRLGWLLLLALCAAPAAGVILGWIVYGFWLAFKP